MRHRLLVVLVGAGVVLGGLPAVAAPAATASTRPEQEALGLLESAARAGRVLTYSGTQYLATWRGRDTAALVQVAHDPVDGPVVTPAAPAAASDPLPITSAATLDPRLLGRLASTYDLVLLDADRCAGRPADVVEARRPQGAVAGRFWVDRLTGLLLRRDVFDEHGSRISSSAFLDVEVAGDAEAAGVGEPAPQAGAAGSGPGGSPEPLAEAASRLRAAGWEVPEALPLGFGLFDTRLESPSPGQEVLHLAYSDGLSTVSLFAQPGQLGTEPPEGFTLESAGGRPVWKRHEAPERVVWSGNGRVWTLISDAPPAAVRTAVAALPRDPAPRTDLLARLGRGLTRLAGMVVGSG